MIRALEVRMDLSRLLGGRKWLCDRLVWHESVGDVAAMV